MTARTSPVVSTSTPGMEVHARLGTARQTERLADAGRPCPSVKSRRLHRPPKRPSPGLQLHCLTAARAGHRPYPPWAAENTVRLVQTSPPLASSRGSHSADSVTAAE